jgi:hypothetical protein
VGGDDVVDIVAVGFDETDVVAVVLVPIEVVALEQSDPEHE